MIRSIETLESATVDRLDEAVAIVNGIDLLGISKRSRSAETRDKLWKDLYTEYDARRLFAFVAEAPSSYSSAFWDFFNGWASDEVMHAAGFIEVLSRLFEEDRAALWAQLAARESSFERIEDLVRDEYSLLIILALDEILTVHAYAEDRAFYSAWGAPGAMRWLRRLMLDEARHFRGAVQLLTVEHRQRSYRDAEACIDQVLGLSVGPYQGTFLMDYFGDEYTSELMENGRAALLRALERSSPRRFVSTATTPTGE